MMEKQKKEKRSWQKKWKRSRLKINGNKKRKQQKRLKQEINRDGSKLSKETIRSISEVAKLFIDAGMVTPFRTDRALTRSLLLEGDFIKIYVTCSLGECARRELRGLYKKVKAGEILGIYRYILSL
jgi:adenylylsulfate kinase-like enzyme